MCDDVVVMVSVVVLRSLALNCVMLCDVVIVCLVLYGAVL